MNTSRETVLRWLADNHHSRKWLAEKCEVSPAAVSNWLRKLNPQPVSARAALIIESLMDADRERLKMAQGTPQNLVLEFTGSEFDTICEAAALKRKNPRQWAQDTLNDIASQEIESFLRHHSARSAAAAPAYDKKADTAS